MTDWRDILRKRETDTHFVVEGRHGVERLLESPFITEKVIEIGKELSREEASELLGFHFHRSHLAVAEKPATPVEISHFGKGTIVILPEIADPGNLGTIIRNTAALGGGGIILHRGVSPFNAKAVRASAGAVFKIPVRRTMNLCDDLTTLRTSHTLVGTSLTDDAIPFKNLPRLDRPTAILLGPEDFGLSTTIRNLCHHLTYLPMSKGMDSLNVAATSAILLHSFQ